MFEVFIPLLLEVGFTQAKIDMLLKENPKGSFGAGQYD